MIEKVFCKKCGNEMEYFRKNHTQGWICPVCGDGMVTSYFDPIESDFTVYTIHANAQKPLADAIKTSAEIFCCNYLEARKGLMEGSLQISEKAQEIQKKAFALQNASVLFHIEPDFPYPIEAQQS